MLGCSVFFFCCCCVGLLPLSSSLVHGNIQLDDGRRADAAFLAEMNERGHAPDPVGPALLPVSVLEDEFLLDDNYEESSRALRAPRRCVLAQQSCLGLSLPCCDPCDTCYCRFFNAICYCRRVGHACPSRRA